MSDLALNEVKTNDCQPHAIETCIRTTYILLYVIQNHNPIYLLFSCSCLPQNLMLDGFISLPLLDPCITMSD